jgi:flagellar biosynthesis GTPase FlhF
LINQLPAIPDFPTGIWCLIGAVVLATLLSALVLMGAAAEGERTARLEPEVRRQLLEAERTTVKQRLKDALPQRILIDISREEQPQQVDRSDWAIQQGKTLAIGKKPPVDLKPTERTIEVLQREDIGGRLLILGDAGSGKTTTLLELADELLEEP